MKGMKTMHHDAERMIAILTPVIDRKCAQIQQVRTEKLRSNLFAVLCAAVLVIPTIFVFFGISLVTLLIPAVFTASAFLLLSPILIHQQGGIFHEQV